MPAANSQLLLLVTSSHNPEQKLKKYNENTRSTIIWEKGFAARGVRVAANKRE